MSLTKTHLGLSSLRLAEGQGSSLASTVRTIAVCAGSGASVIGTHHGRMNYKDTKPYMSAFLKIDLLTDFAALCLTDFIDWRYIHSLVCIFDPACELLPPWTKELYLWTVAPLLFLLSDLLPPPPLPNVQYMQTVCYCGGGGGGGAGGMLNCAVDHILHEFYTLFLTRFRTYKIATPPQTKMTNKDDIKD